MKIHDALQKQSGFSQSEKEIADFILGNKEKVLEMSAHDICEETFTSTSSVVRLCRKIGLDGFKDFKLKYAAELERKLEVYDDVDADFPFEENDSVLDIAQKMNVMMTNTLSASYDMITRCFKNVEKAVDMIMNADHIAMIGMGDSYLKAQLFQSNMLKIGKVVLMCNVPGEDTTHVDFMTDKDCAIIVSYSGENADTVKSVPLLRRRKTPIIAITSKPDSSIGKYADIILEMPEKEGKWEKQATFTSQIATEYYLNILYSCIYVRDYRKNTAIRRRTIEEHTDARI